jgi:hypothetical protein
MAGKGTTVGQQFIIKNHMLQLHTLKKGKENNFQKEEIPIIYKEKDRCSA